MTANQLTVTVHVDAHTRAQLEHAARLQGLPLMAFVEGAASELARRVLLEWAISRYIEGNTSFSELAKDTGLSVEEIMRAMEQVGDRERAEALAAMWDRTRDDASEMFLTSAKSIARIAGDSEFLERAKRVAAETRATDSGRGDKDGQP